ncbi:MAG TPA: DUF3459 domain-containing protein, partial [Acidimicrobiales bacterium]|nr:DUF3459 domain-containing protein [Acidimicrobiales bacterium]
WGAATRLWLPFPPEPAARSVEALRADDASILHLYRRLLAARRASPALRLGGSTWLDAPAGVLAWERVHEPSGDRRVVAVNLTGEEVASPPGAVEVASAAGVAAGRLGPWQAAVLR